MTPQLGGWAGGDDGMTVAVMVAWGWGWGWEVKGGTFHDRDSHFILQHLTVISSATPCC